MCIRDRNAIALDRDRNIYVAGRTWSGAGFPVQNGYQTSLKGTSDAFVWKITAGAGTPVQGDVDGNGTLSMEDVKLSLRIVSGLESGTTDQVSRGEMSAPAGSLTLSDVTTLLRKL